MTIQKRFLEIKKVSILFLYIEDHIFIDVQYAIMSIIHLLKSILMDVCNHLILCFGKFQCYLFEFYFSHFNFTLSYFDLVYFCYFLMKIDSNMPRADKRSAEG